MTDQDEKLSRALHNVGEGKKLLTQELRRMARGEAPYRRFLFVSPWIKNVWRAAADLLDAAER